MLNPAFAGEPPAFETHEVKLGADHPLASLSGSLDNAPWWDDFIAAKRDYRREVDTDDSAGWTVTTD